MEEALYAATRMVISPTALLVAVTVFGLGVLAVIGIFMYLAWRFVTTVAVLRMTTDPAAAAKILSASGAGEAKKVEKTAMEMPPTGIDDLNNNPEAIANVRKKQDSTPADEHY